MGTDQMLLKIRALNSEENRLITEATIQGDQELEQIVKLTKDFYAKLGITASEALINAVIKIYGKGPAIALARKLKKNPTHFIGQIFKEMGLDATAMAQQVNANSNQSNDPAVMAAILAALEKIESSASATRSVNEVMSADLFAILQKIPELMEYVMKNEKQAKGENVGTEYDNIDLTNREVTFSHGSLGKVYKGTVLVDSDNALISQEYLDALNKDKNPPIIHKTKEDLEEIKGWLWVQVQNTVMIINKTAVHSQKSAGIMADFLQNASEETKSLFQEPLVFFSPVADGENLKKGNKLIQGVVKTQGKIDHQKQKHDDIMRSVGMSAVKSKFKTDNSEGEWHSPIESGEYNNPIVLVLDWISRTTGDSGIDVSPTKLLVSNAHIAPKQISSKYFKVQLKPYTREKDIASVNVMWVFGVDKEKLLIFCKEKNIIAEKKDGQIMIKNNF